ncbi:MAG: hypothetical protein RJA36_3746 [Pseudomonadota bacterium]
MPPTGKRKRSARFIDIASEAGVSMATADRVLNERESVSPAARARVLAAAQRLGINRHLPQPQRSLVRIDLLLPRNETPFFTELRRALDAMQRGEAVVTVVTEVNCDTPHPYVGIDNRQAGRTAGHLLRRLCPVPGRVLLLSGRSDYLAHQARQQGCEEVLSGPGWQVVRAPDTHDSHDGCYFAVLDALKSAGADGPLLGIYNTGGGSEGVAAALWGMDGRVAVIGHEASDECRQPARRLTRPARQDQP